MKGRRVRALQAVLTYIREELSEKLKVQELQSCFGRQRRVFRVDGTPRVGLAHTSGLEHELAPQLAHATREVLGLLVGRQRYGFRALAAPRPCSNFHALGFALRGF